MAEDLPSLAGYAELVRATKLEALARAIRQQTADLDTALWVTCWINGAKQKDIGQICKKTTSQISTAIREFIMRYHPNPPLYTKEEIQGKYYQHMIGQLRNDADRKLLAAEALGAWAKACALAVPLTEQKL